jgi:hypothetical protein
MNQRARAKKPGQHVYPAAVCVDPVTRSDTHAIHILGWLESDPPP